MALPSTKRTDSTLDWDSNLCIHEWFEAQVRCQPDAVAVVCDDKQLTYQELNSKANQLAHHLQARKVEPDVLVGICLERSLEMVVGLLGILKAGGAYVPLDPAYPKERLSFILEETQVPLLLTQQRLVEELPQYESQVICLDTEWDTIATYSEANPVNKVTSQHLAYIMYTSGSTGKPKGVQITHANVCPYIEAISKVLQVDANDNYLHTASFSFSSSVRQLMVPLTQGATSIIATEEQRKNPLSLFELIQKQGVTISDTVPSVWRYGLQALETLDKVSREVLLNFRLRLIIFTGELTSCKLLKQLRNQLKNQPRFFNVYGQTETIGNCAYPLPEDFDREEGYIPVGYPYPHNQAYILDEYLQPVAVGEIGELHMAGACLARGYFNRPDLNAAKFVSSHFVETHLGLSAPAKRLFKTGDLARYLPDGAIEIVGRVDFQVKLRGMRVELGEIESVLEQHPNIKEVVVTAKEDDSGDKRLVGYIVPTLLLDDINQSTFTRELRQFLQKKLADYMIPASFVMLPTLPLTPNGKVDRLALPTPDQIRQDPKETFIAPQNELELQLTKIWEKVLDVEPIGITDNFFELGGHSLLVVQLLTEVQRVFHKNLTISSFLEGPTIEQQATLLNQQEETAPWRSLVRIRPGSTKSPFFCIHAAWGTVLFYQKLVYHLALEQPFYALQARGLDDKQVPLTSINEMAAHYIEEIRLVQPKGPYFIGGYSFGGLVAFEIARQLHAQGQEIALLALMDTAAPGYHKPTSILDDGQPSSFGEQIWFHWRKLLRLSIQDQLSYLWERLGWHFTTGRLSIFYKTYLRYVRRSPQDARILDVARANIQAAKSYVPLPYSGQAIVFRATDKAVGFGNDLDMGWSKLVTGGVKVYEIDGNHHEIIEEPQVKFLAEKLQLCLEAND